MIGLDTCAIIDIMKGDIKIKQVYDKLNEPLCTTIISYLEIQAGLDLKNKKHQTESKTYEEFFNDFHTFDLTRDACKRTSKINKELREKGKTTDSFDCTIAGILMSAGITKIITRNKKHFENIKGLTVISY